jgi:hypothetical protein
MQNTKQYTDGEKMYFSESAMITNDIVDVLYGLCATPEDKAKLSKMGFVKNSYENQAGALSFAERKVNFTSIEKSMNFYEEDVVIKLSGEINKMKEDYLDKVENTIKAKDWESLATIKPKSDGDISKIYSENMKAVFEV